MGIFSQYLKSDLFVRAKKLVNSCYHVVALESCSFFLRHISCTFSCWYSLVVLLCTIFDFQQGEISMEVMFVAPDEDSDDENNEYEDEHGFRLAASFGFHYLVSVV